MRAAEDASPPSAAMWLASSALETERPNSSNDLNNGEEVVDSAAMVAAAVGAFSAAAGRNSTARSNTSDLPTVVQKVTKSEPYLATARSTTPDVSPRVSPRIEKVTKSEPGAPSEQRKEDKDEVGILRLQLENARREAEDARRLGAENERLRSEMHSLSRLKADVDVQASAEAMTSKASCLTSPASVTSTARIARSPRPLVVESIPQDVVALERQLIAERRESEKLRLRLFAALQDPLRDKDVDRDKTSTHDVDLSTHTDWRQRSHVLEASPAWEWLAASEERPQQLRPVKSAASSSLQAMGGLEEHVRALQSAFHGQKTPTAELVKLTQQFVEALRRANRQWSMAQAQHAGRMLEGVDKEKQSQQWTRDWSELLAENQPASLQVKALMRRMETLHNKSAKIC